MSEIIAIDLFCGAGGLTRGFRDAGIKVVCGIDVLDNIKKTYEGNNKGTFYLKRDVTEMRGNEIKAILGKQQGRRAKTMLAGCAPCQPFSNKNKNKNREDSRKQKTLIDSFSDLVKETLPDFVFMENVPGIRICKSNTFQRFISTLNQNNYSYDCKVMDAASYGVPQHRKRLILIASKTTEDILIPEGEYGRANGKQFNTVRMTIGGLPKLDAGMIDESMVNHRAAGLSAINKKRIRATSRDGGNRLSWDSSLWLSCHKKTAGFNDTYARMHWDKPAPTLTTRFFAYSTGRYGHPEQDRAISLKEGALLQSFPDDYLFAENDSIESIARQIGNAVPPKMAEAFGSYILSLSRPG